MPFRLIHLAFALTAGFDAHAQEGGADPRIVLDAKILDAFRARNIGPAIMGGRIVAFAVVEKNPDI